MTRDMPAAVQRFRGRRHLGNVVMVTQGREERVRNASGGAFKLRREPSQRILTEAVADEARMERHEQADAT